MKTHGSTIHMGKFRVSYGPLHSHNAYEVEVSLKGKVDQSPTEVITDLIERLIEFHKGYLTAERVIAADGEEK